ncbi:MAG: hypothetical protein JNM93_02370 [Bacteriovoracaceae bacterium]|nr:hypothetical protein [Bacteriovoracaceae bacterium]
MHKLSLQSELFYVDNGDTFYPNIFVPPHHHKSYQFIATEIAGLLDKLNLKLIIPGEYDLALGPESFSELIKNKKYQVLFSNIESSSIPFIPEYQIELPGMTLLLLGIATTDLGGKFEFIELSKVLKNKIPEKKNDNLKIIVFSHLGMTTDKKMAEDFPAIDWIVGSHTQSFTQAAEVVGKTKIVQVLSKNHYLGEIKFDLTNGQSQFALHEVRDELKNELNPNPLAELLVKHHEALKEIQKEEQLKMMPEQAPKAAPAISSCVECHQKQVEFWQSTAHALAFQTLVKNNKDYDPQCIGCHSLHFGKPTGFSKRDDIVKLKEENQTKAYWAELETSFKNAGSIREMKTKQRVDLNQRWMKLDQKFEVTHNFANIQCFHCHNVASDHPFNTEPMPRMEHKSECLKCHTTDQSIHWYKSQQLDEKIFHEKLKSVTCPKDAK